MQTMVASGTVSDPYFYLTTLLLNTTSTDGAKNNMFQDSSSNGYTITRNPATGPNAPTQGTFTPFSQTGWSNYLNGTTTSLRMAANSAFDQNAGSFSVECWVYPATIQATTGLYIYGAQSNVGLLMLAYGYTTGLFKIDQGAGGGIRITSTSTYPANAWYHVAYTYDGSTLKLFINGILQGSAANAALSTRIAGPAVGIGEFGASSYFNGYVSNFRICRAAIPTAYQTASTTVGTLVFTPPTSPLTTTSQGASNVTFLTSQSNRFVDNSSSPVTITTTGTPSVQAFSPFAPTAAYSTSVIGGSGYFDRSGDSLDVGSNANLTIGTSDFTIAMWAYFSVIDGTSQILVEGRPSSSADNVTPTILYSAVSNSWSYRVNGAGVITGTASVTTAGQWYYIVVSRLSGTTRLFVNGAQQGSNYTDGNNYVAFASDRPRIADRGNNSGTGLSFGGYISGLQILVGTGTSAPVTPTAPPTSAVANTQLLLNFTNAGIYDAAAKIDLETVGNAQVSTTQAKFGTTSIYLDGGYLYQAESNTNLAFDSGDFTIEFFIRLVSAPLITSHIIDMRPASTNGFYPNIQVNATRTVLFVTNSGTRITSAALSINVWTYVALIKSAGETKLYFNGVQTGSTYVDTNTYLNSRTVIGASSFNLGNSPINAYFDEFRFTKGLARTITLGSFPFSTSTAAPTEAFPIR